jgi:hypothetical protein
MRMHSSARRLRFPAAAVLAVTAAGMLAAAVPAQAASAAAGARHLPNDQRINAQLVLDVQQGASVTIRGGGGGTSNCTKDETDKTVTVKTVPQTEDFGMTTKSSGSCFYERSWSDFSVTVRDKDQVVASQRLSIDQPGYPFGDYVAFCQNTYSFRARCNAHGLRVELTQLVGKGRKTAGQHTRGLELRVGGPGPEIHVIGGGGGPDHSNCTNDETNHRFQAGPDPVWTQVSFTAKSSGACAFEPSYSYFKIHISGRDAAGRHVSGMGRVFLGQSSAGRAYDFRCEPGSADVSCHREDGFAVIRLVS